MATETALDVLDRDFKISEPLKTPNFETVELLNNGMVSVSTPRGLGRTRTIMMSREDAERLGHLPYAYKEDLMPKKLTFMLIGHLSVAILVGVAAGTIAVVIRK